jgi:coproporphyrinogen III oxidase-like Fe-S oxidoreductase
MDDLWQPIRFDRVNFAYLPQMFKHQRAIDAAALPKLAPMIDDGLVEVTADRIEVTPLGRMLVRNIAMSFDAYLGSCLGQNANRFSRTV